MFISHLDYIPAFLAGDHCLIRELIHPAKDMVDLPYSLAYAEVEPYQQTLIHVLEQSEVYYILTGQAIMFVDTIGYAVEAGSYYCVPPGAKQWIKNTSAETLVFLCIVAPPWSAEGEAVLE